ncbi:putative receptor protein kinase ZmPK1 [Rhododendron vialii]|uniref:putative receptor protein kinase ZmPK1 n=1 Tax=Rhododendron vialii TaxID=182163 RepID=UPI00265F93EA|nr:putative receptor protein kinase ZmPK1 [Rhododendron vialii]
MDTQIPIVLISLLLSSLPLFSISSPHTLLTSSSLSVSDVLFSPNRVFSAGFHFVGENAYCFSIWFTQPTSDSNLTVVWTANHDKPINGKRSKLSLLNSGDLILTDAAQFTVWSTNTKSIPPLQLQLLNTGNLVLRNPSGSTNVWESFDSPTDTLLPNQPITRVGWSFPRISLVLCLVYFRACAWRCESGSGSRPNSGIRAGVAGSGSPEKHGQPVGRKARSMA